MKFDNTEENYGAIYQSLIDSSIFLHTATMGKAKILLPLNFPREDVRISYGFASYKKIADSLEDHIKNAIRSLSPTDNPYSFEHWSKYIEEICSKLEDGLDDYEPEWEDELSQEDGREKFYYYILLQAGMYIKSSNEYKDLNFVKTALAEYLTEHDERFVSVSSYHNYQSFMKAEFVTKASHYIVTKLRKEKLWEDLD